jgi:predicted nucleotidyltransferase
MGEIAKASIYNQDMSIDELLQKKRKEILQIAAQHGAHNVRIFGSVARGEARLDSDIDFLVELEPGRSLLDRVALIQDLEDLLGKKVDVATAKGLRESLRDRILNEALPL